ncbi:hypothetical protein BH09ACT9_BH09ACT9_00010 [soil metagenome]
MKEAALACGIKQNSWAEWETKNRTPRNIAEVSEQIMKFTGANDYWLMTGRKDGDFPSGPIAVESSTASGHAALAQSVERFTRNDKRTKPGVVTPMFPARIAA